MAGFAGGFSCWQPFASGPGFSRDFGLHARMTSIPGCSVGARHRLLSRLTEAVSSDPKHETSAPQHRGRCVVKNIEVWVIEQTVL